jgi:hypothetical protein
LLAQVRRAVEAWPQFAATAQVSQQTTDRIRDHHELL